MAAWNFYAEARHQGLVRAASILGLRELQSCRTAGRQDSAHRLLSSCASKDSAAMFGSILVAQAKKNIPEVEKTIAKINDCLNEKSPMSSLLDDLPLIEKSLMCFESDYQKAMETKNDYFINLIGNLDSAKIEIEKIPHALNKLKSFSE